MTDDREQLRDVCEALGISIASTIQQPPADADEWQREAFCYRVTLTYQGRKLETLFYMGKGHVKKSKIQGWPDKPVPPTAADVLASLCSDAGACTQTFEEWCDDFGYDTDSRSRLALYLECQTLGTKTRRLLGADFDRCANAEH